MSKNGPRANKTVATEYREGDHHLTQMGDGYWSVYTQPNGRGKELAGDFKTLGAARKWSKANAHIKEGVMSKKESLNELSKKTLGSYIKKAAYDVDRKAVKRTLANDKDHGKLIGKSMKRLRSISRATERLTKEDTMTTKPLVEDETEQVEPSTNPFEVSRELYDQLIQGALAGNAVDVRNAVNDIMVTKAAEVVDVVKDEVAQTMFGTDDRPKGDEDDEDEWEPEDDDEDLDDEDDDTEQPEFDDEDDVEGYDDDDDDLPDDDDEDDETEEA